MQNALRKKIIPFSRYSQCLDNYIALLLSILTDAKNYVSAIHHTLTA
jgi:hypothetical protein